MIGMAHVPWQLGGGKDRYNYYVDGQLQLPEDLGGGRFKRTVYDNVLGKPVTYEGSDSGNLWKKGLGIGAGMLGAGMGLTALAGYNPFPWAQSVGSLTGGIGSNVPKGGGLWPMDAGMKAGGKGLLGGLGSAVKKGAGALLGGGGDAATGGGGVLGAIGSALGKPGVNEVIGGLLADTSIGGGTGGSKHRSGPWSALQPFVQDIYGQAQNLYNQGPHQSQYMTQLGDFATRGLGAQQFNPYTDLLAQDRRGNPYLDTMYSRAAGRLGDQFSKSVLPGIHAAFSGAGATGDALHGATVGDAATGFGQSLADLASNMYGQAYDRDMSRNLQGQMAAGRLYGQDLYRNMQGQQFAAGLLPQLAAYDSPWRNLQQYSGVVGQFPFTESQSETDQGLSFSLG